MRILSTLFFQETLGALHHAFRLDAVETFHLARAVLQIARRARDIGLYYFDTRPLGRGPSRRRGTEERHDGHPEGSRDMRRAAVVRHHQFGPGEEGDELAESRSTGGFADSGTTEKAMISEMRDPIKMRLSTSRPTSSVPNQ